MRSLINKWEHEIGNAQVINPRREQFNAANFMLVTQRKFKET